MINKPEYVQTNVPGLMKDLKSGAIVNVDNRKLEEYKKKRKQNEQVLASFSRLDKLENEMTEIKHLLQQIFLKVS